MTLEAIQAGWDAVSDGWTVSSRRSEVITFNAQSGCKLLILFLFLIQRAERIRFMMRLNCEKL